MGSINSIRNLDNEQTRLRPLVSFHEDEDDIVESKAKDLILKVHTQDSEVETLLVEQLKSIKLALDHKKVIERKKDIKEDGRLEEDDYFSDVQEITMMDETIEEIQMPYSMRHQREE
ncbi:hypothetical protein BGX20_008915 [Mortierella sp. AD010]|nr:hypothetical protein BGX20_008915 [Mortierella sp. AD010]